MSDTLVPPEGAIGVDEFAELVFRFKPLSHRLALAVSGGPDSMALALCFKAWAHHDIIALIVDHGLREGSTAEARLVQERLQTIGVPSDILSWTHGDVTSHVHERARTARYELLVEACCRLGVRELFLAHHREDQAETILMRLAKASGVDGLAGMSAQTHRGPVRLLRPFLSLGKERLIATCQLADMPFIVDPSNQSDKFARGRLRTILPLLAAEGLTVDALTNLGVRAAETKEALDYYTRLFLDTAVSAQNDGTIKIDRARLRQVPRAIGLRALTTCLRHIHQDGYSPQHASLSSLLDAILDPTTETTKTLYGCMVSISADRVMFFREPAAINDVCVLSGGETVLWDKRWFVTALPHAPPTTLRALGEQPHERLDQLAPDLRRQVPQGRVRAGLPGLWQENKLHAIPSFDEKELFSLRYRKLSFP